MINSGDTVLDILLSKYDIVKEYKLLVLQKLAESSKKRYLYALSQFDRFLADNDKKLDEAKVMDAAEFIESKKKNCKDRTVRRLHSCLKRFFEYLYKKDQITAKELSFFDDFSVKVDTGDEPGKILSEKEIEQCFQKITHPLYRFIFWLGINFGLRSSEYNKIKLADITRNEKGGRLRIREAKGKKTRFIPITKNQMSVIEKFLNQRELDQIEHEYLLYSKTGKVLKRTLERYFVKLSEMAEIKFTSHDLRRTYATRLWRLGKMDIFVISKMLGHSSIKTTMKYLRPSRKEIEKRYLEIAEQFF